jgi:hypothetical protein
MVGVSALNFPLINVIFKGDNRFTTCQKLTKQFQLELLDDSEYISIIIQFCDVTLYINNIDLFSDHGSRVVRRKILNNL